MIFVKMGISYPEKIYILCLISVTLFDTLVTDDRFKEPSWQYLEAKAHYGLNEPWQMHAGLKFIDLVNVTNCNCPKVYYPVCAENNVTYVNACISTCFKLKLRRYGPCIIYRRNAVQEIEVALPDDWKTEVKVRL